MPINHHIEDSICIVSTDSETEIGNSSILLKFTEDLIEKQSAKAVLIDLEHTSFLNSSGVGKIVTIHKMLEKHHIPFALCNLSLKNQKIFTMTQLDQLLKIYPTKTEALSALTK